MSRKQTKRKQDFSPDFATTREGKYGYTVIFHDMTKSDAFKHLSGNGLKVYIVLRHMYHGTIPPYVHCAYSTFKKYGINEHMASKGTAELQAFGFITIKTGGFPAKYNSYTFVPKWKIVDGKKAKETFITEWKRNHKTSSAFK